MFSVPALTVVPFTPAPVPQQPAQVTSAPQQPAPQGRRRRNTAAAPAQPQQEAPFMAQPQANGPASNFGIQQGAEPSKGIADTLNNLFGS